MWHDHDQWIEQLRELMGDEFDQLDDDDLMFVSNLAAQAMHGEISLPQVLAEIHKWGMAKSGAMYMSDEAFDLELRVNHPELIDVTNDVHHYLLSAGEPGIADGLIAIWAHPAFTEWVRETSWVAMKGKRWFDVLRLNEGEHATLGWAIAQAVRDANG